MSKLTFIADKPYSRLDYFIQERLGGISKNKAREVFQAGNVLLNGAVARPGLAVKQDDVIEVMSFEGLVSAGKHTTKETLPPEFAVLYEDESLIVVSKPRKMSTVRLRQEDPLTLADCVVACSPSCLSASPDPREGGLVQRLDFFTSGVVVAAKSRVAWESVRKQLFAEKVEKTYLALVERRSVKKRFTVSLPLVQSADGKSMEVIREQEVRKRELSAHTEVTVLGQFEQGSRWFSVIRAKGHRVRRHQIRAHLAATSHPLVGDQTYGSTTSLNEAIPWAGGEETGFLLHAQDIRLQHPITKKELYFQATSDYFRKLIKVL